MDLNRRWTQFAVDAEVEYRGTARLCAAHNALREEVRRLRDIAEAAARSVRNPAWCGICDEDVELERVLRAAGLLEQRYNDEVTGDEQIAAQ